MAYNAKDSELSHVHFDGVLVDLILPEVNKDKLPDEDIQVPEWELPANDQDGEQMTESVKEKEEKWNDLRTTNLR